MLYAIGIIISWLGALGCLTFGTGYLLKSEGNGAAFGLPVLPSLDARAWWQVKGIRDVGLGLTVIVFILFAPAQLPLLLLVTSVIPFGDAWIILANHGSRKAAFSIHVSTAVALLAASALLVL